MLNEGRLHDDVRRAEQAKHLLEDELLNAAFKRLEEDYTSALFMTNINDQSGREKLFLAVNVLRKVRDHLTAVVSGGTLANHHLRELAEVAERKKTWPEVG